jgi:hypothetical protein
LNSLFAIFHTQPSSIRLMELRPVFSTGRAGDWKRGGHDFPLAVSKHFGVEEL